MPRGRKPKSESAPVTVESEPTAASIFGADTDIAQLEAELDAALMSPDAVAAALDSGAEVYAAPIYVSGRMIGTGMTIDEDGTFRDAHTGIPVGGSGTAFKAVYPQDATDESALRAEAESFTFEAVPDESPATPPTAYEIAAAEVAADPTDEGARARYRAAMDDGEAFVAGEDNDGGNGFVVQFVLSDGAPDESVSALNDEFTIEPHGPLTVTPPEGEQINIAPEHLTPESVATVVRAVQSGRIRIAEWSGGNLVSIHTDSPIGRTPALPNGGNRADFMGQPYGEHATVEDARAAVEAIATARGWAIVKPAGKVKRGQ